MLILKGGVQVKIKIAGKKIRTQDYLILSRHYVVVGRKNSNGLRRRLINNKG